MKKFLFRAYKTCTDFSIYEEISKESLRNSFFYFLFIVIMSALIIYPRYFKRQTDLIYPYLNKMTETFPNIYFKNNEIIPEDNNFYVLNDNVLSIVIDPNNKFNESNFFKFWLHLGKNSLQLNYRDQIGQAIPYTNSFISVFLEKIAKIEKGSGVLNGDFFENLKDVMKKSFFSTGIYFCIHYLIMGFISTFIISLIAYFYSRILVTTLSWKELRCISYYAITPVFLYMIFCYYTGIAIAQSYSIYFLIYFLFVGGAIYRFRIPLEENFDE